MTIVWNASHPSKNIFMHLSRDACWSHTDLRFWSGFTVLASSTDDARFLLTLAHLVLDQRGKLSKLVDETSFCAILVPTEGI